MPIKIRRDDRTAIVTDASFCRSWDRPSATYNGERYQHATVGISVSSGGCLTYTLQRHYLPKSDTWSAWYGEGLTIEARGLWDVSVCSALVTKIQGALRDIYGLDCKLARFAIALTRIGIACGTTANDRGVPTLGAHWSPNFASRP